MAAKKKEHNLPPVWKACSNDDLRPALQHVEIKHNIATATDGHVLVRVCYDFISAGLTQNEPVYIHWRLFKLINDSIRFEFYYGDDDMDNQLRVRCTDKNGLVAMYAIRDTLPYPFPNYKAILPKIDEYNGCDIKSGISVNPKLLQRAYDASGIDIPSSKILMKHESRALIVAPYNDIAAVAIIMPVYVHGDPSSIVRELLEC